MLGGLEHFHHRDAGGQRAVLRQANQCAEQRGEGHPCSLGQNHPQHDLAGTQADHVPGLPLAFRHRLDGGADGLGHIGRVVQREGDDRRRERIQRDA